MKFKISDDQGPIFKQISQQIKDAILNKSFKEGEQVPSTTEISKAYKINPATVLKGMNLLVEEGLIEKRRGIGMFILEGAYEKVMLQKRSNFLNEEVNKLISEAQKLNITKDELIDIIGRNYQ